MRYTAREGVSRCTQHWPMFVTDMMYACPPACLRCTWHCPPAHEQHFIFLPPYPLACGGAAPFPTSLTTYISNELQTGHGPTTFVAIPTQLTYACQHPLKAPACWPACPAAAPCPIFSTSCRKARPSARRCGARGGGGTPRGTRGTIFRVRHFANSHFSLSFYFSFCGVFLGGEAQHVVQLPEK